MTAPETNLLGTPREVEDYRRWQAGQVNHTLAPVREAAGAVNNVAEAAFKMTPLGMTGDGAAPPSGPTEPPGSEPPVRTGPRTHQEMLDSPIFGDEYRRQLAAGAQPLSDTPPVEVQAPAPTATVEAGGRPGKAGPALEDMANDPFFADAYRDAVARGDIVPDKLEQMASGMDPGSNEYKLRRMAQGLQPNAAPADIAGVGPSATRPAMSPSEKIAQRMALEAKDAAYAAEQAKANPGLAERVANKVADFDLQNYSAKVDANRAALETSRDGRIANGLDALYDGGKALLLGAAPFAAAAWMGAREAATMNPEGDLRYMSFNLKQGPLNMGKVGQHKDYLLQHPDVTHQLWMDGVLSSEVYDELNAERMSP